MKDDLEQILKSFGEIESSLTIEEALWKLSNLTLFIFKAESVTIMDVSEIPYHFVVLKNVDSTAASELEESLFKGKNEKNLKIIKETKSPLILEDTLKYEFWLKVGNSPRSWIGIPILVDNEVKYIINIDSYTPNFYNDDFQGLAEAFSMYASSVIEKNKLIEQLFKTAAFDKLTEVQTRQQLFDELKRNIDRYKRYGVKFSCLMLDLDKFKNINDTYGHNIGDIALKSFAKVIKENLRQSDYIFRFGGDEFIIKLEEAKENEAYLIAKRLKELISSVKITESLNLSTSIGVKEYKGESLEEFLKKLDEALYKAKKSKEGIVISD
ncbi:sensor domain-containing diguanylate cyclase [Caldisericum exile]|uniref:diguanylate cyclase n=1 Tax=Caldisericum exile (strain DSM 21853 / NBRC 104410 / AZM16c01) TaxID=511051 RepID=A0A7U6GDN5_CALEA|nr:diguanylate cyclase [Caldisericum exile]BAL80492.1 hypothetical protein CSE_03660 [Caldisericum exile AZM16c01]